MKLHPAIEDWLLKMLFETGALRPKVAERDNNSAGSSYKWLIIVEACIQGAFSVDKTKSCGWWHIGTAVVKSGVVVLCRFRRRRRGGGGGGEIDFGRATADERAHIIAVSVVRHREITRLISRAISVDRDRSGMDKLISPARRRQPSSACCVLGMELAFVERRSIFL